MTQGHGSNDDHYAKQGNYGELPKTPRHYAAPDCLGQFAEESLMSSTRRL